MICNEISVLTNTRCTTALPELSWTDPWRRMLPSSSPKTATQCPSPGPSLRACSEEGQSDVSSSSHHRTLEGKPLNRKSNRKLTHSLPGSGSSLPSLSGEVALAFMKRLLLCWLLPSLPSLTSSSDTDNVSGTSMNPTCLFKRLLEGLSEGDSDSELVFCGGAFFLLFCLAVVVSDPLSSLSLSLLLMPLSWCRRFLIQLDRREGGGFTLDLFFDIVGFFVMMGGMAVPHGWGSFILSARSTCFMDMWLVIGRDTHYYWL